MNPYGGRRVWVAGRAGSMPSLYRGALRGITWLGVGTLGLELVACTSSRAGKLEPPAPPPPAVVVTEAIQRTVPIYEENVAQTIALQMVALRAQIAGTLEQVFFKEGTEVKRGQTLAIIDQRPYV